MDKWLKPIEEGFEAGIEGLDPRLCPYDKMTEEYYTWVRWHGFGTEVYLQNAAALDN